MPVFHRNIHKSRTPRLLARPSRVESELGNPANSQTNPEAPSRLTRRPLLDIDMLPGFELQIPLVRIFAVVVS
jgi:hypothetical protein